MKSVKNTFPRILAIAFIFICTSVAWFFLGGTVEYRSAQATAALDPEIKSTWGPPLVQQHPQAWYMSPSGNQGKRSIKPTASDIDVSITYEPKRKGLLWYRTYDTRFSGKYEITNPTPISQTVYISFQLPSADSSYNEFVFNLAGKDYDKKSPVNGLITQAVLIPAASSETLRIEYQTRGMNFWRYEFADQSRVQNFILNMRTSFDEINFPTGTGSPTSREQADDGGWNLQWNYTDVIGAREIGMDMPKALNAGPVASRISFFAPVSLLFFFAVLLILGMVRNITLHPMNYFFLAAGFFAFQLLFSYLVDLLPLHLSFFISAAVSVVLVCGYLNAVGGKPLLRIALPAQIAYMVLFSYSFFFDGLSGLTITIGAIATLAILMNVTAKIDWATKFGKATVPPAIPSN